MRSRFQSIPFDDGRAAENRRPGLLRRFLYKFSDLIAVRTTQQIWRAGPYGRQGTTYNILEIANLAAALDTAQYYLEHLTFKEAFETDLDLLSYALSLAPADGLFLEFGVATGRTINHIAAMGDGPVHGFDSFQGLPETWRANFSAGAFAQGPLPKVNDNVALHVGLFDQTLPEFLKREAGAVAFAHIDCDLYSSTATILEQIGDRLRVGTILVFDEYWNYPGWRLHEWKAFQEFVASRGIRYDYIGFVPNHQQVAVRLTAA